MIAEGIIVDRKTFVKPLTFQIGVQDCIFAMKAGSAVTEKKSRR